MGFDVKSFRKAKFEDRTAEVPVPDLKDWFAEGEEPVFIVRGLTAEELARCNEAVQKNKNISSVIEALHSSNQQEKVQAMREMLGVSESVPNDLAKRLEQFALGTVDPDMDHELAVKFAESFPVEFYQLTNKIMELTGQGRQVKKKQNSKQTPKSEQPSPSAASEDDSCTK
jgi:hypothetical protein